MLSQLLQCQICLQAYNLTTHLPKVIPLCGHSICLHCLSMLLQNKNYKCPFDKAAFPTNLNNINAFATNYALTGMIEGQDIYNFCSVHKSQREEYFCLTDKCKVCSHCVIFGEHKDHEVKSIVELKPIADEKRKKLETAQELIESNCFTFDKILEESRSSLLKLADNHYSKLENILKEQKQQLIRNVNTFFDQEKSKFKASLGTNSSLKEQLSKSISNYKNFTQNISLLETIEQDISHIDTRVDRTLEEIYRNTHNLKQQSQIMTNLFEKIFDPQISLILQFESANQEFSKHLDTLALTIPEDNKLSNNPTLPNTPIEITTRFTFNIIQGCLTLAKSETKPQKISLDLERFRGLKAVSIEIGQGPFSEEDFKVLKIIWPALIKITSLQLLGSNIETIEENNLAVLFNIIFTHPENLLQIELNFQWTKINDEPLIIFAEKFLTKARNLQALNINLNNTNITNSLIVVLGKKVLPLLKKLKSLTFDFGLEPGSDAISGENVEKLFISIPTLQSLSLCLDGIDINDQILEVFINNTMSSMKDIQQLHLGLWKTRITDQSVIQLINKMSENIQVLSLDLRSTQITNKSIEAFLKVKLPKMKNLKEFELDISNTQVTKQVKAQLAIAKAQFVK